MSIPLSAIEPAPPIEEHPDPLRAFFRSTMRNRSVIAGGSILIFMIVIAIAAPLISVWDPLELRVQDRLLPPSSVHWFGTDDFGRDVFARVLQGARISLEAGVYTAVLTMIIGLFFGLLAGYFRSMDNIIMRIADGMMAFPSIVLAIALLAALGPTRFNVVIAMTIVYIPRTLRIVRSAVMTVKSFDYIEAARALGATHTRIILRYILPNCLSPLIVQATFTFAYAILAEAGLSFLGLGTPPPAPSWGNILSDGRNLMDTAPWMALFPGFAIALIVLGLNLLGDGLRDQLDPRMKS